MKLKWGFVSLLMFLAITGVAQAFVWHLSMSLARTENVKLAREICEEDRECIAWSGRQCQRVSESRIDCLAAIWYPGAQEGEEIQCDTIMHWGTDRNGYVVLKRHGRPHCFSE